MTVAKGKPINFEIRKLIQRQLMLLDFQEKESEWGLRTWPTLPGNSPRKSMRLFEMLERWGWIAGSPLSRDSLKCIITSEGVQRVSRIREGQPILNATDLDIVDCDRHILCEDSIRPLPERITSWLDRFPISISCLWVILCLGILLIVVGIHLWIPEGTKIPGGPSFKSWGTLSVALGASLAFVSLRIGFRHIERRYPAFCWLPAGVALLVFIPIAWLLFNDMLQFWLAVCILAGVGIAGIPLTGSVRKPLVGSDS